MSLRLFFLLLATTGLTALTCAQEGPVPPEETPNVQIIKVPAKPAPNYAAAVAKPVDDREQLPRGFWVHGELDDTLLKNDLAVLVFGKVDPDRKGGESRYRNGTLLDIATSPSAPENFWFFSPNTGNDFGTLTLDGRASQVRVDPDGSATYSITQADTRYEKLNVTTTYKMNKDTPGVLITSVVTNLNSEKPAENIYLNDYVALGVMDVFIPGLGTMNERSGETDCEFIFAKIQDQVLFLAPEKPTLMHVRKGNLAAGTSGLAISHGGPFKLEPGESKSYSRWLLIGQKDPSALWAFVQKARGENLYGTLVGRVVERAQNSDGSFVERGPVADSDIQVSIIKRPDLPGKLVDKPYLLGKTDENGSFSIPLPEGEYNVRAAPRGRLSAPPNRGIPVRRGKFSGVDLGASQPSGISFTVVDADTNQPVPCKVNILPLRGTMGVDFGPGGQLESGTAIVTATGKGQTYLNEGNYKIVASRGPEYNLGEERFTVSRLQMTQKTIKIKRAYKPTGWVSADVGVRTDATTGCRVTPENRVITAAAEGVKWLVTGDTDAATDLEPAVRKLGLESFIKTSVGYRTTGERKPLHGDFTIFPLDQCSSGLKPDLSAIKAAKTAPEIVKAMRAVCPNSVILLSRAIYPAVGYLTLNGFDIERQILPKGDYTTDFDALQVWEGKRQGTLAPSTAAYHTLLQRGARITAFGNSNSFGTWNEEVGYPRVYIKADKDTPETLDTAELSRNIKKGLVSITNGPFIDLKVDGKPVGSLVTDTDHVVDVIVNVYAPSWISIQSISINVNGRFSRRVLLPGATKPGPDGRIYPPAERPADSMMQIAVYEDCIIDVTVEGDLKAPMDPVNPHMVPTREASPPQGQFPLALSAPVLLDADGDGKITLKAPEEKKEETPSEDVPF